MSKNTVVVTLDEHHIAEVIERFRAALPQWQPIETAPKDGTKFLAFSPCGPEGPIHHSYFDNVPRMWVRFYCSENGWRDIFPASFGPTPTHWIPLPEPPDAPD